MKRLSFLLGTFALFLCPHFVSAVTCGFGSEIGSTGQCRGYLTSTTTTTFIVPSDWGNASNTIEVIGAGGMGGDGDGASGGGGGGYSKVSNQTLTGGASVTYQVGWGGQDRVGADSAGTDTYFCNSSSNCATIGGSAVIVGAKGGGAGETGGDNSGGAAASGIGTTKYSGGNGGGGQYFNQAGGGGGGAAGPLGNGANGAAGQASTIGQGGGGGGNGGGSNGVAGGSGGTGGNNAGGTGGGAGGAAFGPPNSVDGTNGGGGGGGGFAQSGGARGGDGTEWDSTHGSGGGGGGGSAQFGDGGRGGDYGGGGGGNGVASTQISRKGGDGIIVIIYEPSAAVSTRQTLGKPPNNLGLVAYWSFNEGASTIAGDFSGNGNSGTLTNGPTWTNGKFGKGLLFDGSDDYIQIPDAAFGNYPTSGNTSSYDRTFSVWFKTTTGGVILGQTDNTIPPTQPTSFVPALYIANSGTVYGSMFWHNDSSFQNTSSSGYSDGIWHHLVNTYSGGSESLYLDGILVDNQTPHNQYGYAADYNYFLGVGFGNTWAGLTNAYHYFAGSLDDMRIYSRALSAPEVLGLYKSSSVTFLGGEKLKLTNGLVGYWPFNGGDVNWTSASAGVAYDRSGIGNNGTLVGMNQSTSTVRGKMGQALSFGVSGGTYVDAGNANVGSGPQFTVAAWVYRRQGSAPYSTIVYDEKYFNNEGYAFGDTSGGGAGNDPYRLRINGSSGASFQPTEPSATFDEWTHYVGLFDGDYARLYKNGVLVDSVDFPGSFNPNTYDTAIIGSGINGYVDDVRFYNRALSVSEIKQLYNLGTGTVIAQ